MLVTFCLILKISETRYKGSVFSYSANICSAAMELHFDIASMHVIHSLVKTVYIEGREGRSQKSRGSPHKFYLELLSCLDQVHDFASAATGQCH